MEEIIKYNRKTLGQIDNFIEDSDYNDSADLYGLPKHVYHLINKPINNDLTYVDLLTFLHSFLGKKKINYLEIGVSVLKTFYQMANFFKDSNLYAYDINYINPTIEKHFNKNSHYDDKLLEQNINHYTYNSNNICYYRGDVFRIDHLEHFKNILSDNKIDILFSDAHHSYNGLISEYNNFINNNILSDNFILYYDDLQMHLERSGYEDMTDAFLVIAEDFQKKYTNLTIALVKVNGWLGNHEFKHVNGIITTLNLKEIFKSNNIDIEIDYIASF